MPRTIWHFTLLVSYIAFFPLPPWFANTFSVDVVALARAEERAHALTAMVSVKSWVALTLAKDAGSVSMAAVHTPLRQLLRVLRHKDNIVFVSVVVVDRHKPMAFLHEEIWQAANQFLSASGLSLVLIPQTRYHLHEVVVRVCWESVPTCVQPK